MSCEHFDRDQSFIVHDYGPQGYVGTASIVLQHGMQPGTVLSVVTNSTDPMEINVKDVAGNYLLHIANRASKNDFAVNSYLDGLWGTEEKVTPVPVRKGVRTVTTVLYQTNGYRVFINGKEIAFYKHRSSNDAHQLHMSHCQIFKIVYLTIRDIIS